MLRWQPASRRVAQTQLQHTLKVGWQVATLFIGRPREGVARLLSAARRGKRPPVTGAKRYMKEQLVGASIAQPHRRRRVHIQAVQQGPPHAEPVHNNGEVFHVESQPVKERRRGGVSGTGGGSSARAVRLAEGNQGCSVLNPV